MAPTLRYTHSMSDPRCPICKRRLAEASSRDFAPFCSKRCKTVDLGQWLGEGYRIPDESTSPPDLSVDPEDLPS